jgi:hypothetical protein
MLIFPNDPTRTVKDKFISYPDDDTVKNKDRSTLLDGLFHDEILPILNSPISESLNSLIGHSSVASVDPKIFGHKRQQFHNEGTNFSHITPI